MNDFTIHNELDRQRLLKFIAGVDISRPLKFTWKLFKYQRSLDANALLHVWLGELVNHPSFADAKPTKEHLKTEFKKRFLSEETVIYVDRRTGEEVTITRLRRTRDLDAGEFCFFLQQIEAWALHYLGVILKSNKEDEYQQWQREQAA